MKSQLMAVLIVSILQVIANTAQALSSAKAAAAHAELPAAAAVLGDFFGKPTVDVTFFRKPLSDSERQKLAALGNNAQPGEIFKAVSQWPILEVNLWFREDSTSCDFANLLSFTIVFYKSEDFSFPVTNSFAQQAFASSSFSPGDFGLTFLSCQLKSGSTLRLQTRGSKVLTKPQAKLVPGVSELPLSWDLNAATTIYARPAGDALEQKYARLNFGMSYSEAAEVLEGPGQEVKRYQFTTYRWKFSDGSRLSVDFCDARSCGSTSFGQGEAEHRHRLIESGMTPEQVSNLIGPPVQQDKTDERIDYRWDFGKKGAVNTAFQAGKLKHFSKTVPGKREKL